MHGNPTIGGEVGGLPGLPPESDDVRGAEPLPISAASSSGADARLIQVYSPDGCCWVLDLVLSRRRSLPRVLHHDVPFAMRPADRLLLPPLCYDHPDKAAHRWGCLPSLPPAAPAPRMPRARRRPPPPDVDAPDLLWPPPAAVDPPETRFPYVGDLQGATWNAQALFARKRHRHEQKDAYMRRLLRGRDFVAIADSHGLEGVAAAWSCPDDCRCWFSPGTTRRAGVGIVIKKSFLQQFAIVPPRWVQLVPGRAAVLQLRGTGGALDLHVVYFATGEPGMVQPRGMDVPGNVDAAVREQRRSMRSILAAAMSPRADVLSMVMGDFNWVTRPEDRVAKTTGACTGTDDQVEEREAEEVLWRPAGMYEIRQSELTHENGTSWSRLDRCYWNADPSCQLDRTLSCTALEWVGHLSAHRAVAFGRRTSARRDPSALPVRPEIIAHPSWPVRVAAAHQELREQHVRQLAACSVAPLRDLALLKQAMRLTADRMHQEAAMDTPTDRMEDEVGHVVRFIRAAERGAVGVMRRCLKACPRLSGVVAHPLALAGSRGSSLQPFRLLAAEWARAAALADLAELHRQRDALAESELGARRNRIHHMLKRLSPGRAGSLAGVAAPNGEVLTDPSEMAAALRQYWGDVFSQRPVDEQLLERWVADDTTPPVPPPGSEAWRLRRRHVQTALDQSPNSAPGPDGLTFAAWRRLGPLAVDVLWSALHEVTATSNPEGFDDFIATFNCSLMVFLPKGEGTVVHGITGHNPSDTRPLNIACCDNRVLANAVRLCVEEPLTAAVSEDQHGFIPRRSMLANVVDIDEAMMRTALQQHRGAAWFFDFKAAFPSVAHRFLQRMLRAAGLPEWLLRFVDVLYQENRCSLVVGAAVHAGFTSQAGIRQGCPLSPILFAVALDVLLRRLRRLQPALATRAFADDISAVTPDLFGSAPGLHEIFTEFGQISGLHLNLPKTVLVPLFHGEHAAILHDVLAASPGWGGLRVAGRARYLGYLLGPDRGHSSYDKAFDKVLDRAAWWGEAGGGLYLTSVAYSVYITSVVGFLMQLEAIPTQRWEAVEKEALRRLVSGSTQWTSPGDLRHLQVLGFPRGFADMQRRQRATQLRVAALEDAAVGGLRIAERAAYLRQCRRHTDEIVRAVAWADWLDRSFLQQLDTNMQECRGMGVTICRVECRILGEAFVRPLSQQHHRQLQDTFQRTAESLLPAAGPLEMEGRVRHKLDRWVVPQWPRLRVAHAMAFLRVLGKAAPPRVWAAAWRALWNGWATARRTQGREGLPGCMFRCSEDAPDSIEHYANCRAAHAVLHEELGFHRASTPGDRLAAFLGMDYRSSDGADDAALRGIRLAGLYKVHCLCSHGACRLGAAATEALRQACREAVKGHRRAGRAYDAARDRFWHTL